MAKVSVTVGASFLASRAFSAEVTGSGSAADVKKAESEALEAAALYINEERNKRIPEDAGRPGPERPESGPLPPTGGGFQKP